MLETKFELLENKLTIINKENLWNKERFENIDIQINQLYQKAFHKGMNNMDAQQSSADTMTQTEQFRKFIYDELRSNSGHFAQQIKNIQETTKQWLLDLE